MINYSIHLFGKKCAQKYLLLNLKLFLGQGTAHTQPPHFRSTHITSLLKISISPVLGVQMKETVWPIEILPTKAAA